MTEKTEMKLKIVAIIALLVMLVFTGEILVDLLNWEW